MKSVFKPLRITHQHDSPWSQKNYPCNPCNPCSKTLRITLYHGSPWPQRRKFAIHFIFPSLEHIFCNPLQKGADRKRRLKTPRITQITQISHKQKPIRVIRVIRVQAPKHHALTSIPVFSETIRVHQSSLFP